MSEPLENVESALYGHMLKQAFIGFAKSALIGAVLGAAVGAVLFLIPTARALLPNSLLDFANGSSPLAGALAGAAVCFFPAGAMGATSGINSARDARRYVRIHEAQRDDALLTPEHDVAAQAVPEPSRASYRDRLKAELQSQPGIQL